MTKWTEDLPNVFSTRNTPHGPEKIRLTHHYSARLIAREAKILGISFQEIPESRVFILEYQGVTRFLHSLMPSQTSELAYHVCRDKVATHAFLEPRGISMAKGFHLLREDSLAYQLEVFSALEKPLVIKPAEGKEGALVFMGIETQEHYLSAVQQAFTFTTDHLSRVLIEETVKGTEYRILTTRNKVVAIVNREPANVTGDGISSISELIFIKNSDPRRGDSSQGPMTKIKIDQHVLDKLTSQNLTLNFIPTVGTKVHLRHNSNISTGGDSIDFTNIAHPSVQEICVKIVNSVPGLHFCGIDFMTTDITAAQTMDMYKIIEINSFPGLDLHEFPYSGQSRPAARELLRTLFAELPLPASSSEVL